MTMKVTPAVVFASVGAVLIGALVVAVLVSGGNEPGAATSATTGSRTAVATSTTTTTTTTATTTPPALPKPEDFSIAITVLEKKCFGSAGCSVTYRIVPSYLGLAPLTSARTLTVIYEVTGGESPQTNRFTLTGESVRYQPEERIDTDSSSATLTAKVVKILDN